VLDNVSQFPSASERLAAKARQAQQHYAAALADADKGQQRVIEAVAEYGQALLEGREGRSNKAFSEWVTANGLDVEPPWDQRPERSCAMAIAQLVSGTGTTDTFATCPHTRPTNIMKWYRQRNAPPEQKKSGRAERTERALEAIRALEALGEPVTVDAIAERARVSNGTAGAAYQTHYKAKEAADQATAETTQRLTEDQALEQAEFSPKGKLTIAKAVEIYKKRLMKSFQAMVQAEAIKLRQSADESTREHNKQLLKENLWLQQRLNEKALFTQAEWRVIQMALHPDNAASAEVRARAFDLMKQKERRLVSQQ
jgi:hypothetical protein